MGIDYNYFDWEQSPKKRLDYLISLKESDPENTEIDGLLELHKYRFTERKGVAVDEFVKFWLLLSFLASGNPGSRNNRTEILSFVQDENLCKIQNEYGNEVFEHELTNSLYRYYYSCLSDRNFGSTMLGLQKMDDDKIMRKLSAQVHEMSDVVPVSQGLEAELAFISSIMRESLASFKERVSGF